MKHFLLLYTTIVAALFVLSDALPTPASPNSFQTSPPPCGPPAQIIDSLSLVNLHLGLNGGSWVMNWTLTDPVCSWFGITLDANGFVTEITLNSNGLSGNIPPDIGLFSNLRTLQLDNNFISGSIPAQIGLLSNLEILFLDDNVLSGELPTTMGDLQNLQTVFLDNNFLTGTVPASMATNPNLQRFEIFHNRFDSLPDFSGVPNMQDNRFKIQENRFTFDDILPNLTDAVGDFYHPQDSICERIDSIVGVGSTFIMDLDIDDAVGANLYTWFKDGLPYGIPTNSNQLVISPVTFGSAGDYTCEVTNPGAPLLTLYCRPTTLTVVCAPSTLVMDDVLCEGQTINVNGTNYSQFNTTGTENLGAIASTGCDSIVDVQLSFIPPPVTNYSPTFCPGETEIINGTLYSAGNATGTEIFTDAIGPGCDSTVNISLNFLPSLPNSNYNETICDDEEVIINGNTYNFGNPSGIEVLSNASEAGCDSLINVSLNFYPPAIFNYSDILCEGESVDINGTTYDAGNANGQEIITDASVNGCDSTINVAIIFYSPIVVSFDTTLCVGESLLINGTTYSSSNNTGTEVFAGAAANGCDSTVNVTVGYFLPVVSNYTPELCPGDFVVVNGTTYNGGNLSGTEILSNAAANGCDSTVNVSISFSAAISSNYAPNLCPGDFVVVNGTTYNSSNASGIEILSDAAANGCDSTVNISLNFLTEPSGNYSNTLCPGGSEIINGTTYNAANPTGIETLPAAAANGCDSTVNVAISFFSPIVENYTPTFCSGQEITIQGTLYNAANPTGTEIFSGAGSNGCDSTVMINLSFGAAAEGDYTPTLCPGGAEVINGTTYNAANPTGAELLPGMGSGGCDSIVNVSLNFFAPIVFNYNNSLCSGSSEIIHGTTYNEANPSGIELFSGAGANGCDSTVNINLTFVPAIMANYNPSLCPGDAEIINGTTYNAANPTGVETFPGMGSGGCDSILNISLSFSTPVVFNYNNSLCVGGSEIINGTTYNQSNPTGIEVFPGAASNSCDSTVNINLTFTSAVTFNYSNTLCPGDAEVINGTTYNAANPTGSETYPGMGSNGCDSIVTIALDFFTPTQNNYNNALCEGGSEVINGTTYNQSNPTGIEVFTGGASNGCDSIVNITLSFIPPSSGSYQEVLCPDDNVVINGITFDAGNPSGTVTFPAGAQNGCDSLLTVSLNFYTALSSNYNLQLCTGGSTVINGTTYNESNPTGLEIFTSPATGCDSLVNVNLTFGSAIIFDYNQDFCPGESVIVNGTTYDAANPTGAETFPGMGMGGCDSTVNVTLNFMDNASFDYLADICPGEVVLVNGIVYDQNNLSGTETLSGVAANGCDSIISVNLTLLNNITENYSKQLCTGQSELINGTLYNEFNTTGIEIFSASNGCDSMVNVALTFVNGGTNNLDTTLCEGSSITVNGVIYDENNPTGIEIINLPGGCDSTINISISFSNTVSYEMNENFCDSTELMVGMQTFGPNNPTGTVLMPGQSQNGCDSLILVNLTYFLDNSEVYNDILCSNESLTVNGTIYDASNTVGTEVLLGAAIGGCDSTVNIQLSFLPEIIDTITGPICFGENINVNGNIYDVNNPTGVEIFTAGSVEGCDSTVVLELEFLEELSGEFNDSFCTNAEITINGTIYDENNPTGQEVITSVDGCDSLLTINLTFSEIVEIEIDTLLCEGIPLEIGTETIESEGTYTVTLSGESSGGCDSIVTVTLTYEDPFVFGAAEAGVDQIDCTETAILEGQTNTGQTGFWTSPGLAILDHINQPNTGITNLQPGPNTFIWSVNSEVCDNYDQDTMVVTFLPLPVPFYDSFAVDFAVSTFELDVLANDSFPWAETPFTVTAEIDTGGLIIQENDTTLLFAPQPSYTGLIQGTYFICGTLCPDECYEQPFVINLQNDFWGQDDGWNLPNGITPNGDGANDQFVIDPLLENPEEYENNELVIFNRYGSIVFRAQPYLNDWDGKGPQGTDLPEGTYYYVLRLNLNDGEVFKGDVTIIR